MLIGHLLCIEGIPFCYFDIGSCGFTDCPTWNLQLSRRCSSEEAQPFHCSPAHFLQAGMGILRLYPISHRCTHMHKHTKSICSASYVSWGVLHLSDGLFFCFVVSNENTMAWKHTWKPFQNSDLCINERAETHDSYRLVENKVGLCVIEKGKASRSQTP